MSPMHARGPKGWQTAAAKGGNPAGEVNPAGVLNHQKTV
jgi:hypothetical protein